jgi:hypothetical protein
MAAAAVYPIVFVWPTSGTSPKLPKSGDIFSPFFFSKRALIYIYESSGYYNVFVLIFSMSSEKFVLAGSSCRIIIPAGPKQLSALTACSSNLMKSCG